jgi:hypothetical protein
MPVFDAERVQRVSNMAAEIGEVFPQGLKPLVVPAYFGTTEVVP